MTASSSWHLEARWQALPLIRTLHTARGALDRREGWLVRWSRPGEPDGVGEVAPLPDFGTEDHDRAAAALASLTDRAHDPELLLETLPDSLRAVRFGLQAAWTEVLARRAARPVWCELGGTSRGPEEPPPSVLSQGLLGGLDGHEVAFQRLQEGHETLKIKVGLLEAEAEIGRLEALVRALREAGCAPELRLDANGAWAPGKARQILTRIAPLGFRWIEEPIELGAPVDLSEVASWGVPVALDERLFDASVANQALTNPAVSALVLKPTVLGGLDRARAIAVDALVRGKAIVVGSSFESAVGLGHLVHLAASLDRPDLVHGLGTLSWFRDEATSRELAGSLLVPPDAAATTAWAEQITGAQSGGGS